MTEVDLTPEQNAVPTASVLATGEPQRRETQVVRRGQGARLRRRAGSRCWTARARSSRSPASTSTSRRRSEARPSWPSCCGGWRWPATRRWKRRPRRADFLANMSHELRTPLNAIIGFTRLVSRNSRGPARAEQVDNLSKILVSAEHLLALIDEILDLSRIEAGEVTLDIAETDVADVLREVTDSLEPLVDRPRVQLVVDARAELAAGRHRPGQGQADPAQPGQQRDQVHRRRDRSPSVPRRSTGGSGSTSPTRGSGSPPTSSAGSSTSSTGPTSDRRPSRARNRPRPDDLAAARAGARRRHHGREHGSASDRRSPSICPAMRRTATRPNGRRGA